MTHATTRPFHPRALSDKEHSTTRWLITHANISDTEKKIYLGQLEAATVVRMCECGCASIDFAIAGVASESVGPLHPFGDFITRDRKFGVFVFSKHDTLAGVEIYSMADPKLPPDFPSPETLVAFQESNTPVSRPANNGGGSTAK